ncbi:hypothetical protein JWR97_07335 [Pseudomonas cedrina subsp. fulgida]|nr:hypothetical protein [Pseudomonas cedrina subsp. fulgida]
MGLADDIDALRKKGSSVLQNDRFEATDFIPTIEDAVSPGKVVSCAISGNGYCVVTNKVIKTDLGDEWALQPATNAQAIAGGADQTASDKETTRLLKAKSEEMVGAGCGGMGPISIGCQTYTAFGGTRLLGEQTTEQRVMWGSQALLNIFGLAGAFYGGAASTAGKGVIAERGIVGAKGPGSAGTGTTAGSNVASTTPKAGVFWSKTTVLDRTVYQRNDLFDPEALSTWRVRGKTVQGSNLERMASGRAPIGYDGKSVELHHLSQTEVNGFAGTRGSLAEVGSVFHSQNSSVLHVPSNAAQSFRYTRYKDSAEYRNPTTDYVSVPTDLNAKTLTKQAKEFNSYQSDYWKLRARSGE